ncbi:hypothetical protein [Proteiniborus sp. MB09-C3]|uniref:hypothetical protein n=1 Tax=Proteiniborus sp. MB09-C3 TaxID=3050072 RepID=UPI0025574364|nr:hypothetical protein [Proteiniborus sp. MB09-C3]WIV12763.1 hypothetical protein QO263_03345 [Proteiniborus sp. MB09-C3]
MENIVVATESMLTDWVKIGLQLWLHCTDEELRTIFLDILKSEREYTDFLKN